MSIETHDGKTRYLACHDYGMGGLWWWIWARSAEEITTTFAELLVVTDEKSVRMAAGWDLDEVDIDTPLDDDHGLADLRAKRDRKRHLPGFGALAGRERVCLRVPGDWNPDTGGRDDALGDYADHVYLTEYDADGRRVRDVEIRPDGEAVARDWTDWPINPPIDLYEPVLVPLEIDATEFEDAWRCARPWTDDDLL